MGEPISLEMNVYIRQNFGGQLQLSQTIQIPATDFAGFARIMARFHELAETIRAEEERRDVLPPLEPPKRR
jgi:hypothetical protein